MYYEKGTFTTPFGNMKFELTDPTHATLMVEWNTDIIYRNRHWYFVGHVTARGKLWNWGEPLPSVHSTDTMISRPFFTTPIMHGVLDAWISHIQTDPVLIKRVTLKQLIKQLSGEMSCTRARILKLQEELEDEKKKFGELKERRYARGAIRGGVKRG
jgi:hypothetical protein